MLTFNRLHLRGQHCGISSKNVEVYSHDSVHSWEFRDVNLDFKRLRLHHIQKLFPFSLLGGFEGQKISKKVNYSATKTN